MDARPLTDNVSRTNIRTWLFNPFHYVAGDKAIGVFIASLILAEVISKIVIISLFEGFPGIGKRRLKSS